MNESMNQEKETKKVDEETSVVSENDKKKTNSCISGCLVIAGILILVLSIGIFSIYLVGVKAVSEIEKSGERLSEILPYGYEAKDIYRVFFDFTTKVINNEIEPETILRIYFSLFLSFEDGVLTADELNDIINMIYSSDMIYI
jgi:hypothetical protein